MHHKHISWLLINTGPTKLVEWSLLAPVPRQTIPNGGSKLRNGRREFRDYRVASTNLRLSELFSKWRKLLWLIPIWHRVTIRSQWVRDFVVVRYHWVPSDTDPGTGLVRWVGEPSRQIWDPNPNAKVHTVGTVWLGLARALRHLLSHSWRVFSHCCEAF